MSLLALAVKYISSAYLTIDMRVLGLKGLYKGPTIVEVELLIQEIYCPVNIINLTSIGCWIQFKPMGTEIKTSM